VTDKQIDSLLTEIEDVSRRRQDLLDLLSQRCDASIARECIREGFRWLSLRNQAVEALWPSGAKACLP